ncbi:sugar ABC transporter permease [Sorangium cellulosum]|uniref:Sugar ABC transporter permease n=1 Tax=Sorangium cellulosum TaxID=56 RepID=A0A4P2Q596_SORCE|nr:carbohydrate ABC transporter permease [Sorangium cellulosum]AUX24381.1 sugar ABC transporter permease [Sorangium cellulosum]
MRIRLREARRPVARRRSAGRALSYAALILVTVAYIAPVIWMVLTSLKSPSEATAVPPTLVPTQITLESYEALASASSRTPVFRWLLNSVLAAVAHALLVLATAAPAAYALARMEFRGKRLVLAAIVSTLFIPPVIFLPSNYLIVRELGWLDRLPALVVPPAASAFGVFFLRQFFLGFPRELEEAAALDGASRLEVFWKIVLPLSKPALATLAVLCLLSNWNDFLWPIYVLFNPENLTLSPGLALLQGAHTTDYALVTAGAVVASAPILAVFIAAQRYVIEGVARTGLKG